MMTLFLQQNGVCEGKTQWHMALEKSRLECKPQFHSLSAVATSGKFCLISESQFSYLCLFLRINMLMYTQFLAQF